MNKPSKNHPRPNAQSTQKSAKSAQSAKTAEQQNKRLDCPISFTLDIFGDKWSLLVVRDLMKAGDCTYGDFLSSDEKISTNILADRLKKLEEQNIIQKLPHPDSRAKVRYRLTEKGIELLPILLEMQIWAEKYTDVPKDIRASIDSARTDKAAFFKKQHDFLLKQALDKV